MGVLCPSRESAVCLPGGPLPGNFHPKHKAPVDPEALPRSPKEPAEHFENPCAFQSLYPFRRFESLFLYNEHKANYCAARIRVKAEQTVK